jgi:hypothetical protein
MGLDFSVSEKKILAKPVPESRLTPLGPWREALTGSKISALLYQDFIMLYRFVAKPR